MALQKHETAEEQHIIEAETLEEISQGHVRGGQAGALGGPTTLAESIQTPTAQPETPLKSLETLLKTMASSRRRPEEHGPRRLIAQMHMDTAALGWPWHFQQPGPERHQLLAAATAARQVRQAPYEAGVHQLRRPGPGAEVAALACHGHFEQNGGHIDPRHLIQDGAEAPRALLRPSAS